MITGLEVVPIGTAIGTKVFTDLAAKVVQRFLAASNKDLREGLASAATTFEPHFKATFERCSKIKTLLNRDEPVDLLSQYVNLEFRFESDLLDDFDVIDQIWKRKKIIISGMGGGGKTIFMKYLWISLFENSKGKIPIFLELRRLNDISTDDLVSYLYLTLVGSNAKVSKESFLKGIASGLFIVMLDGFDEIVIEKRRELEKQILNLANANPELILIVSGRPDERFGSWQAFSNYKVQPFRKDQVIALIEKLHYEKKIKKKFMERIEKDLFEKHKSFLSSPLLATMMLITFDQFADIPEKVHLFYEQAFDTLFAKHDATKEAFKRKMYTDLPIDMFKRYLSFFCLTSYFDEKYEFNEAEMLEYIRKGLKIENASIDPEKFSQDLLESVCILQREGLDYVFSHRTFQEFFAAYCLARVSHKHMEQILLRFARRPSDKVIEMLYDMHEDLVENQFVLPQLSKLVTILRKLPKDNFLKSYLELFGEAVTIHFLDKKTFRISITSHSDSYYLKQILNTIYDDDLLPLDRTMRDYKKMDTVAAGHFFEAFVKKEKLEKGTLRFPIIARVNLMKRQIELAARGDKRIGSTSDIEWLGTTGFAKYCVAERKSLIALLERVEKEQALKEKTIDEIFGFA